MAGPRAGQRAKIPGRVADKIAVQADGCWLWTGFVARNGYGRVRHGERIVRAHRHVYELLVGPIPDGLRLDHLCRVRHCVNPAHLEPVTHRENVLRGSSPIAQKAQQTHCIHGHRLDGGNLYVHPTDGTRKCRTCQRRRRSESRERSQSCLPGGKHTGERRAALPTPTAAHGHSATDSAAGSPPAGGAPSLLDRLLDADGFDYIVIAEAP